MYTTATVTQKFPEADGRLKLEVTYTGDAGETPVIVPMYVLSTALPSSDEFRGQAMNRLAMLNTSRSVLASITIPKVLDTTTPLPVVTSPIPQYYFAASAPFTPGATPQDVFTITGSATKTITVLRTGISSIQTTAGSNWWHLVKRSTANTGGTSAAVTKVPTDDAFDPATATVLQYTANPTAGNLIGRLWVGRVPSPAPATSIIGDIESAREFSDPRTVLSGINDVLAWNFNGIALPAGLSITPYVCWMEF